jgi:hypothetical protein
MQKETSREVLVNSIREELLAFPGVTVSMLHSRLSAKREGWRPVLDELIREGWVLSEPDLVAGRGIRRLNWNLERESSEGGFSSEATAAVA